MPVDLRFHEDEVDEEDHEVVLDILVGETFAAGALGEADVGAGAAGFGVCRGIVRFWGCVFAGSWVATAAAERRFEALV